MSTPYTYCLFGENREDSLRGAMRRFWEELCRRDPDGLRDRASPGQGIWVFPVSNSPDRWKWPVGLQLGDDLCAFVGSPNKTTLESKCWEILRGMGRSRSDFVIYDFPEEPMFPDDARYNAVVREFKQMQAAHADSCKALDEAAGALREALVVVEAAGAFERELRPIDAFLRIKEDFRSLAGDDN